MFPYVIDLCQTEVARRNWVDSDGYGSSAGLALGAWTWYGLTLLAFVLLNSIRGRFFKADSHEAEQVMDVNRP